MGTIPEWSRLAAASAGKTGFRPDWDQWPDMRRAAYVHAAEKLWPLSGFGPGDPFAVDEHLDVAAGGPHFDGRCA